MRASVKKQIQNYLDPFVVQVGMNIERVLPLAVSLLAAAAWVERFHNDSDRSYMMRYRL